MRRNNLTMCNTMLVQKLSCQRWILGGYAQSPLLMRKIIACQVPEISTGAYINPGFWDCYDKAANSIPKVFLKYNDVIVMVVFLTFNLSGSTVFCQDIVAGNAKSGIPVLHQ